MEKEEAESCDPQVLTSPSAALETDPTPPRQESMIQVDCQQVQPDGEGMLLLVLPQVTQLVSNRPGT